MTLEHLEKQVWWWKRSPAQNPTNNKNFVSDDPRKMLWSFELIRRANRQQIFPTCDKLSFNESFFLSNNFGGNGSKIFRHALSPDDETEHGWTPTEKRQWNLNLSDNVLQKVFLEYVQQCRESQGISAPKRNEGRNRRGFSWRWLELMDRKYFSLGKFNDGEKTALASANKVAKIYSIQFFSALREYRAKNTIPAFEDYPANDRFIFRNVLLPK